MSREVMGNNSPYQNYLSKYLSYLMKCPTKGRSKDCIHPCPRFIHTGACEPCTQFVELECYCEATGIVKPCKEWCEMEEDQKQLIKCCRVRCAKLMACGHQCPRICHPGKCADPIECVENVKRHCDCGRIERVYSCRGCGARDQIIGCDTVCDELLRTYRQAIAEQKINLEGANDPEEGIEPSEKAVEATVQSTTEQNEKIEQANEALEENEETPIVDECENICPNNSEEGAADRSEIVDDIPAKTVSRSSSRVSDYCDEDIPRNLDEKKIVKIMRSSTRRKKLIKCDGEKVIEREDC